MEELKKTAEKMLARLKEAGAQDAQVSVVRGRLEEFNVDAGEFSLIRSVETRSAAMKVIENSRKGTVALNQFDDASVNAAVKECVAAARSGVQDDAVSIASLEKNTDFVSGNTAPDKAAFFDSLILFVDKIKAEFPKIMIEQLIGSYSEGRHVFMNSNGVLLTEHDGSYNVNVMYSAHDGDKTGSFNYFDISFLDPKSDIMALGDIRTMLSRAESELETVPFSGKFEGTAVFSPACLDDFLSIITGNFAGDYPIIENTSPWRDKLGKKVADESVTLSVIPLDSRIVCGERITADGYCSENYDIIKDGVLESFCLSEYAAKKTGGKMAKSSSGCIELKAGEKSLDDIIGGIENGILVCRFSGGEPAANGDFSGVAKNSFLIENGRISGAVNETMISGNLADMLLRVRGISSSQVCSGSSVLPYAAFDGVTVSGGGEA